MKKTVSVGGFTASYVEYGAGPVCVLVHGAGANRNYWKPLARLLPDHHVFMPDLFGHGETPAWHATDGSQRLYNYQDDVELLEAIVERSGTPIDLVGHSGGGSVCMEFAYKHPQAIRRLVLVEPTLPTVLRGIDDPAWAEVAEVYGLVHSDEDSGNKAGAARRLFAYILGDAGWDELPTRSKAWMTDHVSTLTAHSKSALGLPTNPRDYASLSMPSLFIHGTQTRWPYKRLTQILAETIPGAQLVEIPGAMHNSPLTHPEPVNAAIVRFLTSSRD